MKVYLYYIISSDLIEDISPAVIYDTIIEKDGFKYSLYAFTDVLVFDKEFRRTRNMDIFIRKTVDLTDEDIQSLKDNSSEYLLSVENLYTSFINENGIYETVSAPFLMTSLESDILHENKEELVEYEIVESLSVFTQYLIMNNGLNKKLLDILNDVLFFSELFSMVMPLDEFINISPAVDELQMFIHIFKNTINID